MTAHKHTLLVVDDEPDVGDSVEALLRREFNVLKAKSADEGIQLMKEHDVHIIMTDQRMPKITGVELLSAIRSRYPRAVRLLFTGFADLDSIIAAINQSHVFQFIKKPWQPEELERAVREAAAEYDRLVEQEETLKLLRIELQLLRDRVAALEHEVARLRER
jgi:response regulator RpfG family c-di-GMP phosphodiesterase